jgi:hypothetical protein
MGQLPDPPGSTTTRVRPMVLTLKRLLFVVPLLLAVWGSATLAETTEATRSFTFEIQTPGLEQTTPVDGYSELRLRGFETHGAAAGAPDVPTRTVLVAIPPGVTPRLTVISTGAPQFRALLPRPAAHVVYDVDDDVAVRNGSARLSPDRLREARREIFRPDQRSYVGEGTFPARVAWLGEIGVLRDQRYVEVHLAPVRFDRQRGGVVVDPQLEVTVHFEGEFDTASEPPPDRLEQVYRHSFENYTQGRSFRLDRAQADPPPAPKTVTGTGSAGPIRRIRVANNGVVRVDHTLVAAEAPELLSTDPRNWRVSNRGQQVPVRLHQQPGDDSLFESGEWLQFYGQALDQEPDTTINYEHPSSLLDNLYDVTDVTDENAYFLTVEAGPQPAMVERDVTPPPVGTAEADFPATARVEIDNQFLPVPGATWFWLPFVNENTGPRSEELALPGLAAGTLPAQVRLQLRGFINCPDLAPDHESCVKLENDLGQTLVLPGGNPDNDGNQNCRDLDGHELLLHDFSWTHSGGDPSMTDPMHVILDAADLPDVCPFNGSPLNNEILLDYIEVDYRRSFTTTDDRLTFDYPDGDALFEIGGFTSSAVEVYEVTARIGESDVVDSVRLTGVELLGGVVRFRMDNDGALTDGTLRRFVVSGVDSVAPAAAADFEADRVSTLISDTTQADLLIIAHADLIGGECSEGANPCSHDVDCVAGPTDRCEPLLGSSLDQLVTQRASDGITSRVARMQDVEDEFNFGVAGPQAIRNFLGWVLGGGWSGAAPAYVTLIGDGSWDYKGGTASGNYVPTQVVVTFDELIGHYPSDNRLAAVVGGDQLADAAIGRITARDASEVDTILGKIVDVADTPPAGAWDRTTLVISDRGANDPDEGLDFEALNDFGLSKLAGTNYAGTHLRYWSDNCNFNVNTCDPDTMKQDIKERINGIVGPGAALVQFAGHGNYNLWSNDVFFCANEAVNHPRCVTDDTDDLTNGLKLPFLVVHNCLTGGFHSPAMKSFGEEWLKQAGGGAIGVYATAGLGFEFIGTQVTDEVWSAFFGPHKERRLAGPVMNTQVRLCTNGGIEACQYYVLLGDPSSEIALRQVGPAKNVVATSSEGPVPSAELTWDPSSTPGVEHEVYRTHQLGQPYVKLTDPAHTTTGFTDTTAQVANDYFYYVLARYQGFDSSWSNFNTDCGPTPGPDCVQAMPLNLVQPAPPTGLTASDPESGGRLDLVWIDSPEPDVKSFTIHYGLTPSYGTTQHSFPPFASLTGLENGQTYYIAVQAKNSSGTTSELSLPVQAVPSFVLGVKSPDRVGDLRLAKSGDDAVLSWSPVALNIYGQPTTVDLYEVYRGEDAQFLPAPANLLAPQPPTPGFTDGGALAANEPYFYLVRAVDDAGNPGGLGGQLPDGITQLLLGPSETPGAVELSWSPVVTDFDGNPTAITHYLLYADDAPFRREDIRDGSVPQLGGSIVGVSVEIVPGPAARYYSVLAVDTKGNLSPF